MVAQKRQICIMVLKQGHCCIMEVKNAATGNGKEDT